MKQVRRKNSKGYTLGQMVTTVAIIGAVTAIAVPNYLRMRMNANMEMVKQQLKVIGEEMTELMGKTGKFIEEEAWQKGTAEVDITANLNGINNKGYTTDQYSTDRPRTWYQFRTCPQNGKWGVSGDKCFLLESTGVKEVQLWEGWDGANFAVFNANSSVAAGAIIDGINVNSSQEEDILQWFLWIAALAKEYQEGMIPYWPPYQGKDPAWRIDFGSVDKINLLEQYLSDPNFYQKLAELGVKVAYYPPGTHPLNMANTEYLQMTPTAGIYAFELDPLFDWEYYVNNH